MKLDEKLERVSLVRKLLGLRKHQQIFVVAADVSLLINPMAELKFA
jgi:hypothetical protein